MEKRNVQLDMRSSEENKNLARCAQGEIIEFTLWGKDRRAVISPTKKDFRYIFFPLGWDWELVKGLGADSVLPMRLSATPFLSLASTGVVGTDSQRRVG